MASRITAPRAGRVVIATVFVDTVGFGMILPLLPSYADRVGGTPALIGGMVAAYSVIQFLLAPLWGRVSDRIGRRPVLLIGLAGSAASYVLFAMADSLGLLLLSRILDGASGATINVAQAYLADETAPAERARAMGKIGAAVGMGFIIGPLLGGVSSTVSIETPGYLAAAITFVNLVFAYRTLPESERHAMATPVPAPLAVVSRQAELLLPLSVVFLATLAFSVMYVVFPLHGEQALGASRSTVSYWFAFVGLVTVIVQGGMLGRLVKRLGEVDVALAGTALLSIGLATIPVVSRSGAGVPFYLTLALIGAGFGLSGPSMLGLISRRTDPGRQGGTLGVAQSTSSMSRIIGPVVAGIVMQGSGAASAFRACAVMAMLGTAVAFSMRTKGRQSPEVSQAP